MIASAVIIVCRRECNKVLESHQGSRLGLIELLLGHPDNRPVGVCTLQVIEPARVSLLALPARL
jgi:hypothetical protein